MAMSRFRVAAIGIAALALSSALAVAAGNFSTYPIVGGASFCSSSSTSGVPGTASVCNVTTPAGPTALTGTELMPADTGLASGQQPQTVTIKPASLGAGPTQYSAPLTGASITIAAVTRQVIIEPAGTIAALTLVFPAASGLVDNQKLGFCSTQIVTALTVTNGTGATVQNPPTAMTAPVTTGAASCVEWVYVLAQTKWYRTQ